MTSGWKHISSSTSQGAATASRAPLTVQACRASSSDAGARVVAQEAGQAAQQPAEVAAADLAGDPQPLDDPVADGVGQPLLEPVEGRPRTGRSTW